MKGCSTVKALGTKFKMSVSLIFPLVLNKAIVVLILDQDFVLRHFYQTWYFVCPNF